MNEKQAAILALESLLESDLESEPLEEMVDDSITLEFDAIWQDR